MNKVIILYFHNFKKKEKFSNLHIFQNVIEINYRILE